MNTLTPKFEGTSIEELSAFDTEQVCGGTIVGEVLDDIFEAGKKVGRVIRDLYDELTS